MTERKAPGRPVPPDQRVEAELHQHLEQIREEQIPERLLDLARQLQAHLRQRETFEK